MSIEVNERLNLIKEIMVKLKEIEILSDERSGIIHEIDEVKKERTESINERYEKSLSNIRESVKLKIEDIERIYSQKIEDVEGIMLEIHNKHGEIERNKDGKIERNDEDYIKDLEDKLLDLYSKFTLIAERNIKVKYTIDKTKRVTFSKIQEIYRNMTFKNKVGSLVIILFIFIYMYNPSKGFNIQGLILLITVIVLMILGGIKFKNGGEKFNTYTKELYGVSEDLVEIYIYKKRLLKEELENKLTKAEIKISADKKKEIEELEKYNKLEKQDVESHYESKIELIEFNIKKLTEVDDTEGLNILANLEIKGNNIGIYDNQKSTIVEIKEKENYSKGINIIREIFVEILKSKERLNSISLIDTAGLGKNFIDLIVENDCKDICKIYTDPKEVDIMLSEELKDISNKLQEMFIYNKEKGFNVIIINYINDITDIYKENIMNKIEKIITYGYEYGIYAVVLGEDLCNILRIDNMLEVNILEVSEITKLKRYGHDNLEIKIRGV